MNDLEKTRTTSEIKAETKGLQFLVGEIARYVGKGQMVEAVALACDAEQSVGKLGNKVRSMDCAIREGTEMQKENEKVEFYRERGGPVPGTAGVPYVDGGAIIGDGRPEPKAHVETDEGIANLPSEEARDERRRSCYDHIERLRDNWDPDILSKDFTAPEKLVAEKYPEVFLFVADDKDSAPSLELTAIASDGFAWFDDDEKGCPKLYVDEESWNLWREVACDDSPILQCPWDRIVAEFGIKADEQTSFVEFVVETTKQDVDDIEYGTLIEAFHQWAPSMLCACCKLDDKAGDGSCPKIVRSDEPCLFSRVEGDDDDDDADSDHEDETGSGDLCQSCAHDYCGNDPDGEECHKLRGDGPALPDSGEARKNVVGLQNFASKFVGKRLGEGEAHAESHRLLCAEFPDAYVFSDEDQTYQLTEASAAGLFKAVRGKIRPWNA